MRVPQTVQEIRKRGALRFFFRRDVGVSFCFGLASSCCGVGARLTTRPGAAANVLLGGGKGPVDGDAPAAGGSDGSFDDPAAGGVAGVAVGRRPVGVSCLPAACPVEAGDFAGAGCCVGAACGGGVAGCGGVAERGEVADGCDAAAGGEGEAGGAAGGGVAGGVSVGPLESQNRESKSSSSEGAGRAGGAAPLSPGAVTSAPHRGH